MGGRDQQQQQNQHLHFDGGDAEAAEVDYKDAQKSLDVLIAYAGSGRGNQADLPKHVKRASAWGGQVKTLVPDIAKHARGEIVFECAALLGMSVADQVHHALNAKKTIGADALRKQLRLLKTDDVAKLGDMPGLVAGVRKLLKGPISKELPELLSLQKPMYQRPEILRWWLETTNPTVAALQLAGWWNELSLVETLDALAPSTPEAWGWLDHLHIAPHHHVGMNLEDFAGATKNAAAKIKLQSLSSKFEQSLSDRAAGTAQANVDLAAQLSGTDDKALLDAAARTQGEGNTDSAKVRGRLAGESADVIGQYIHTMNADAPLLPKVELLAKATGARAEHLRHVLRGATNADVVALLADDRARKLVRGMLGRDTGLRELLQYQHLDSVHAAIVKDEALRQWCYEDKDPRTWLWIAAGSAAGAKDGCRLVLSEKGKDWVKQLPRTADELLLRRFVLNTTDAKLAAWVKANLIADGKHAVREDDAEIVATSRVVYGHGAERRLRGSSGRRGSPAASRIRRARLFVSNMPMACRRC